MRERKTPSDYKKEEEVKAELESVVKKRVARDSAIIRKTFATADGRRCLKMIMDRCKYQSPVTLISADGIVHTENLQHNAALQGLYLWLRKHIDIDTLTAVEIVGLEDSLKGSE